MTSKGSMGFGGDWLAQLREGIDLFNNESFYECHDVIEEIWLQESSDRQPFLQGLIQSAVAFHHCQHGRFGAARSMLGLAISKLEVLPPVVEGVVLSDFVPKIRLCKQLLDEAVSDRSPRLSLSFPRIATLPD